MKKRGCGKQGIPGREGAGRSAAGEGGNIRRKNGNIENRGYKRSHHVSVDAMQCVVVVDVEGHTIAFT